ncbi:hypothetical protein B0H13DRAFT_1929470 [Mycena leptocephala]|nr:hypothetical protein B0H13DRAFT_1929470 [Mycena leptocephala]
MTQWPSTGLPRFARSRIPAAPLPLVPAFPNFLPPMVVHSARPLRTPTDSSPPKPKKTKIIAQKFKHFQPTASSSSLLNSLTVSPSASLACDVLDQLLLSPDPSRNIFDSPEVVPDCGRPLVIHYPNINVYTHHLNQLRKMLLADHVKIYPAKDLFSDLESLPEGTLITLSLAHGLTVPDDAQVTPPLHRERSMTQPRVFTTHYVSNCTHLNNSCSPPSVGYARCADVDITSLGIERIACRQELKRLRAEWPQVVPDHLKRKLVPKKTLSFEEFDLNLLRQSASTSSPHFPSSAPAGAQIPIYQDLPLRVHIVIRTKSLFIYRVLDLIGLSINPRVHASGLAPSAGQAHAAARALCALGFWLLGSQGCHEARKHRALRAEEASASVPASLADSHSGSPLTSLVDYDGCDDTRRRSPSTTTAAACTRAYCAHLDRAGDEGAQRWRWGAQASSYRRWRWRWTSIGIEVQNEMNMEVETDMQGRVNEDEEEGAARAAGDGDRGGLHRLALAHRVDGDGEIEPKPGAGADMRARASVEVGMESAGLGPGTRTSSSGGYGVRAAATVGLPRVLFEQSKSLGALVTLLTCFKLYPLLDSNTKPCRDSSAAWIIDPILESEERWLFCRLLTCYMSELEPLYASSSNPRP